MKKILSISLALLGSVLSGCGGGSGGAAPTSAADTVRLAQYIGTWSEGCDGHDLSTMVIARTSVDTINFTAKTQFYANSGCSGSVLGTETASANVTMAYTSTVDSSIVFAVGTSAVPAKIDLVTVRVPQRTTSVTGSGVIHTIKNGQAQWCIAYSDGGSTCIHDTGTDPAEGPISAGLYASGSEMYLLLPNGSTYAANLRLSKM